VGAHDWPVTPVPASDTQRGLWFSEQAVPAGSVHHLAVAVDMRGQLDTGALERACAAVLARHPILARAFAYQDGDLVLVPAAEPPVLACVDAGDGWPAGHLEHPFDLRRGPLIRLVLVRRAADRHGLLIVAHHLVFDGTSKAVLVRDLAREYAAARDGATRPAANTAAAAPERAADQLGVARRYWESRWREPDDPQLPGLRRIPVVAEPAACCDFQLDGARSARLDEAARALGVTRFEFLLAAFQALLYRYGNPAPTVAVDMSTRDPGDTDVVGPLVNELPVAAPAADRSFAEFARAVRAAVRELNSIRAVALARVFPGMRPRLALAPVSMSYRRDSAPAPTLPGLDVTVDWMVPPGAVRNALDLQVVDTGDRIAASLRYSPAALAPAAAGRIATHLRTLIQAAVADPAAPVSRLSILGAVERATILGTWNRTSRPRAADVTVGSLFAAQATATPDAPAVLQDGVAWSYTELDEASDALAGRLTAAGVRPGDLVGLCLDRSPSMVAALLAVTKVGAAYVPVDPAYPAGRRRSILADAGPAVVFADGELADGPWRVLPVSPGEVPGGRAVRPAGCGARPEDLAYVMYTSGSTGQPKGVMVPHRAVVNLLLAMREELGSDRTDRWLAHTSLSFDISGLELLLPLTTGAAVVLATAAQARSGTALVELIRRYGVSHVQATPSGWRMLLDAGLGTSTSDSRRLVGLTGGEALPLSLARELRDRVRRLVNVYGPTETTMWSTLDDLPYPVEDVTIGRPLANTRAYVLDEQLEPVPAGLPGELYLGGDGLALGYLHQPELTAHRFLPDPFGPAGSRMYRTGDRVSWLPDGRLGFLGRADDQVKIRGHRVELGEVESYLLEQPGIRQAAAALRPDGPRGQRLVGYLVPEDGATAPSPSALRFRLGQVLPDAAIPDAWITLDRLPMTPNGKLDRAALPEPLPWREPAESAPQPAAPDSFLEQVRAIWREALRVEDLGDDEDLFDAGGNSLTVIQIMTEMSTRLRVDVPLDAFYDTPTVVEIVRLALSRSSDARV
jgi:amino acid adenylation domain-containing protein